MRILSDLEIIQHNFAKANSHCRPAIVKIKIGDNWVDKCFLTFCPRCGNLLPMELKEQGIEYCYKKSCKYRRWIYTPEEWQTLGNSSGRLSSVVRHHPIISLVTPAQKAADAVKALLDE